MSKLKPLPYYGGKNPSGKLSKWINGILGLPKRGECYIEPFAGMCGVLLGRPKARAEIINDTNMDVLSWWYAVRDNPKEFHRMIANTPHSRSAYDHAKELLQGNTKDTMQRALAFHIVVKQSIYAMPHGGNWSRNFSKSGNGRVTHSERDIQLLSERMRDVALENMDAIELIERTVERDHVMLYCDPPYPGACTEPYGDFALDIPRMREALISHKGRVAVSGYNDNWDALGFNRYEFPTVTVPTGNKKGSPRTEVLWTNFEKPHDLFG